MENILEDQKNLAVLIDADNTSPVIIEGLLKEIAKYGTGNVKRIYGDWTSVLMKGWKEVLNKHAIQPIQQFSYTTGKNATDSAMIIDAMDLLYTERFDGFCIVSSDSDFTRIASRIREEGLIVIGFGEKKTPEPFVAACDKFVYTEILHVDESPEKQIKAMTSKDLKMDTKLVAMLRSAVDACADDSGWAFLGSVGSNIANLAPDFDPRNYGYAKLGQIIKTIRLFDIDERPTENRNIKHIYIKHKNKR